MWAQDFLAKHPAKKHIINDSKTPSGPVHIGSMRSFVIHDVLRRVLEEEGREAVYHYGFDDYDPMDGVPAGFDALVSYLGKPLCNVPSLSNEFESFSQEVEHNYRRYHNVVGVHPTDYYRTSELYKEGRFNESIRIVLDRADVIRKIYSAVSGSKREDDWLPIQPICPQCGKIGTTYASDWDGKEVVFECRKDLVAWAEGCSYQGKVSPFDGNAKMHWRVEWAAKWYLFNVTIEWAGKDHASKGSSFDTGRAILRDVFGKEGIALEGHEFFLMDGKKMSSSKGKSVLPQDALSVFAPDVFRFLQIRTRPQQVIEIDLAKIVPPTYDEYDRCQLAYLEHSDQDQADFFYYSQIDPKNIDGQTHIRFSAAANLIQLPSRKGELQRPDISPRAPYVKAWLEKYAPDEACFHIQEKLPEIVSDLTGRQKNYLKAAAGLLGNSDGESLQASLYELAKMQNLSAKEAFTAIYLSLIGKPYGPRAGMLLSSENPDFVRNRFMEAAG
jgi:lysyl-tRNA synthetase, class I